MHTRLRYTNERTLHAGEATHSSRMLSREVTTEQTTDGRRLRGARSRETVLRAAVDLGSLEGLDALSFGRLAEASDLSKAGVQVLFKTKEALQLATVERAREMFIEAVIEPTRSSRHGLPRLRALLRRWITYAQTPLFAGGCMRVANIATFDSRSGPVHDALARDQRDWLAVLARELAAAIDAGDIRPLDPERAAFEIDAVLCATNTAMRFGDRKAASRARRIIDDILTRERSPDA